MTAPNDADRLVHAFFQEGPAELSVQLVACSQATHTCTRRAVSPTVVLAFP